MAKVSSMQVAKTSITNLPQTPVKEQKKFDKKKLAVLGASVGAVGLTTAGILYKASKGQGFKLSQFHYNDKQLITIGASAVLGGLIGGAVTDDKKNMKYKYKEALHQFFGNIVAPLAVLTVASKGLKATKVLEKVKPLTGKIIESAVTIGSLVVGMHTGNTLISKVTDKIFHEKDTHKVKIEDYSVHADDLCMAISHIGKGSAISRIAAHCLPFAFLLSGYKTGAAKKED